jgi:4-amino-4-deoxy-L-arabinose transferase-like glycosyltransferase
MKTNSETAHRHKLYIRIWVAILLFSVITRLGLSLYFANAVPTEHDDYSYSTLGLRLATGHGYTFDRPWYPFTPAETPTAHWSFLYTAFVAAVYALVGFQPLVVRLITAVLGGILMPWLAARLTRRLFPHRPWTALIAALATAGYAFFIMYAARLLTETFYILALLWSFERALALADDFAARRSGWGAALGLGVSLGLATLFRQAILPWAPVLFLWLLWRAWRGDRRGLIRLHLPALVLAGMILLAFILPWTFRNYRVYGGFLLLNSNTGYAMYSAQHPLHGTSFQAFTAAPLPDELWGQVSTEVEWDRALLRRGIGFILDEPVRYVRLSLSRVADYFEFWPTDTSLLYNLGRLLSFTLYMPFMLYGIALGVKAQRSSALPFLERPATLLLLFMVFYSMLHIFTWAMPRYRLPVDAVTMPFVALALERVFVFAQERVRRSRYAA